MAGLLELPAWPASKNPAHKISNKNRLSGSPLFLTRFRRTSRQLRLALPAWRWYGARRQNVSDPNHNTDASWNQGHFVTTHWSLILAARSEAPEASTALDQLCRTYWPPLFVYARRDGLSPHDAQDAVQGFIAHLLARQDLNTVSPERGRFRSFLLAAFKHFLVSRVRGESAAKRGGNAVVVRLDVVDTLETMCAPELADAGTPDKAFDRTWAHNLMARALQRLGAEHQTPRQAQLFAVLQPTLMDGGRVSREAELAAQLGLMPGALAVAATRLRRRYRTLIEDEVKQTLANPADLAEEMKALWLAWS
jgi:DNA-directed RNA polymerase specialized sigma24 family protein